MHGLRRSFRRVWPAAGARAARAPCRCPGIAASRRRARASGCSTKARSCMRGWGTVSRGVRDAPVAVEQQVEVERARRVGEAAARGRGAARCPAGASSSAPAEAGVQSRHGVEEIRLVRDARPARCGRAPSAAARRVSGRPLKLVERALQLPARFAEVGAEADVGDASCRRRAPGSARAASCRRRRRRRFLRGPVSGSSIAWRVSASAPWNARHQASSSARHFAARRAQREEIVGHAEARRLEQPVGALAGALLEARLHRPDLAHGRGEPARDRQLARSARRAPRPSPPRAPACGRSPRFSRAFQAASTSCQSSAANRNAGRHRPLGLHALVGLRQRQRDEALAQRLLEDHVEQRQQALVQALRRAAGAGRRWRGPRAAA